MIVYWLMVTIPAFFASMESERGRGNRAYFGLITATTLFFIYIIMAARLSGGDFYTYNLFLEVYAGEPLSVFFEKTDTAYAIINWLADQTGTGIVGVNSVCSLIFLFGLYTFAKSERLPYFLFAIAIPYFTVVIGIGFTRQAVAVSICMIALYYLMKRRPVLFGLLVIVSTMFHASSIILFPLVLVTRFDAIPVWASIGIKFLVVAGSVYIAFNSLSGRIDYFLYGYLESDRYSSDGAFLRSIVHGVAGLAFFYYYKSWREQYGDHDIWIWIAIAAILTVPGSLIASTIVDRLGFYVYPFQLIALARVPTFQKTARAATAMKVIILMCYMGYFATWLHFGSYSQALWVPYRWAIW